MKAYAFIIGPLILRRRDDLQDLLHDQHYFQAVFHSLEHVKGIYHAQDEIVMANEAIASELLYHCQIMDALTLFRE